ncbi:pilus assembly protein [Alcanivorax sp. S6407]|uniref:TadE/TadG family type IV pilus assembly protein n=1 Tax=Alcanivorax sp. S6407 TaxID=2926424 RepID=UPI001FF12BA0|nr:TadE family protein [Alcanivorax sp. S6407]MCK0153400.1 pilus assembly protein [Alcanivorax sp. S6407]
MTIMSRFSFTNSARYQRGAALVEFALLLPLMVVIVFGITELGRAIYQQNTLSKSVASGARYMSRSVQSVDSDCSQGSNWAASIANAANLVAFGRQAGGVDPLLPELDASDVSFSLQQRTVTGGGNACVLTVTASVPFQAIFGETLIPFLDLDPIILNATVEERYHGE